MMPIVLPLAGVNDLNPAGAFDGFINAATFCFAFATTDELVEPFCEPVSDDVPLVLPPPLPLLPQPVAATARHTENPAAIDRRRRLMTLLPVSH
jgi:hypothetical protein